MKKITLRDWEHVLDETKRVFKLPDARMTLADILKKGEHARVSSGRETRYCI
jgi:hypothetical protein